MEATPNTGGETKLRKTSGYDFAIICHDRTSANMCHHTRLSNNSHNCRRALSGERLELLLIDSSQDLEAGFTGSLSKESDDSL